MTGANDETKDENEPTEGDGELSSESSALVERVKTALTGGALGASERTRGAILGRVIAQGDEETNDSALRDASDEDEDSAAG